MKSQTLPIDEPTENVSIQVTNVTARDAQFLRCVIGLFCDPNQHYQAEAVRSGRECLQYQPDGLAILVPVWLPGQTKPQPLHAHTSTGNQTL